MEKEKEFCGLCRRTKEKILTQEFGYSVTGTTDELEKELFDYKSLAKNYRTENYHLIELIKNMRTNVEFSEDYLRGGLSFPDRGQGENISNVFNGPILAYWLETKQCLESELSEEQKYYAGLNLNLESSKK